MTLRPDSAGWRSTLYDIIFEADTPAGRWFDIGLLIAIMTSITIVSLETVPACQSSRRLMLFFEMVEWFLTGLFTIEYVLRLICVRKHFRYAFSFWGVIDLISILPSYATLFLGTSSSFVIVRSLRLLRVFRVLKLWRMMNEADELGDAIWKARQKIVVFLSVVLVAVTISGTLMYHIESFSTSKKWAITSGQSWTDPGESQDNGQDGANESQFTSIPMAMYWAIVTMTTVGYGDIVPQTTIGKMISAILILLGYSLIIVPSTFVSAEFLHQKQQATDNIPCHNCHARGQRIDASYCYRCGEKLDG